MRILVIAPHIDDELIGCSSLFRNRIKYQSISVLYVSELTNVRYQEAYRFTNYFKCSLFTQPNEVDFLLYDSIYIPDGKDAHIAHKLVNQQYIDVATHVYSVDMNPAYPLPEEYAKWKLKTLNEFYLSQKSLWENNAKYWLFENVRTIDSEIKQNTYAICNVRINSKVVRVEIPENIVDKVKAQCYNSPQNLWRYIKTLTTSNFSITIDNTVIRG